MKKILTLTAFLATTLTSLAQGFVFQHKGETLADGETVIIAAEEDWFGDLSCETNNVMNPADGLVLKSLVAMPVTVSATLGIVYNDLAPQNLQWCMGGECTIIQGQTTLTKSFMLAGSQQVQFDATGIQNEGTLLATLKATYGLETHQVNILFVNGDIDAIDLPKASASNGLTACDLHGRQLKGLPRGGIYIVTEGGKHRKVLYK